MIEMKQLHSVTTGSGHQNSALQALQRTLAARSQHLLPQRRDFVNRAQAPSFAAMAIAESQEKLGVGPSWPVVLEQFQVAREVAQSGDFTIKALCDSFAYDRNFVTAKRSMDRHFMYTDATGAAHLLPDSTSISAPTELVDVTPRDLMHYLENRGASEPFWYFTSPLHQVSPRLAQHARATAVALEIRPPSAKSRVLGGINVWMGSSSSSTQAHYDTDDNVFVQAQGSKRFQLFSPARAHELQLFPDAHPRARKSQLDFDGGGTPEADLDITLEPGDCLFIPAFWLHHVEARTASVSINVFSEAPVWTRAEHLLQLPTPADRMSGPLAVESMLRYSAFCLPRVGIADVASFVSTHLLEARYHSVGPAEEPSGEAAAGKRASQLSAAQEKEFGRCAAALEEAVRAVEQEDGGSLARNLVLAHLLELWAVRVGGPRQVKAILRALRDEAR